MKTKLVSVNQADGRSSRAGGSHQFLKRRKHRLERRLADHAYELFRQRQEDIEGSNNVVDVFSGETYVDLMVRRAWGWCRNKCGAPMMTTPDRLVQATILHTDRVGLAFVGDPFQFCRPGDFVLLFVNDLIWCHDHYEVQSLKKHLIIEDFS